MNAALRAMTTSSSGSQEAQAAQIASEKLQVPCDLYGLFVVEPLQLNVHVDGWIIFFLELARTLFLVAVNFSIQLLYVSRIHHLNRRNDGAQCGKENPYMQLVCVFVFTTSIFKELRSCGDLFELLLRCPVRENNGYINLGVGGGSASQQSHGVVLHAEGDVQPPKGFTDRLVQAAKLYRSGSKQHVWTLGSMTNLWKIFCLFFVAVPRSIICLLLLKVASGFVVRSSEETMVVDTVAALFIVDIGNFMYNAFTTNAVKQHLERMPALELQPSNCVRLMNFFLVNFMLPVVTIVFSVGIVWYLRQHCGPQADLFSALGTNSDASDLLAVFSWE